MGARQQLLHHRATRIGEGSSGEDLVKQPRRRVGGQAVVSQRINQLALAAIAVIVHVLLRYVDRRHLGPTEAPYPAIGKAALFYPVLEVSTLKQGISSGRGHLVDDVVRSHVARPFD